MAQSTFDIQPQHMQGSFSSWVYSNILTNPTLGIFLIIILMVAFIYVQFFGQKNQTEHQNKKVPSALERKRQEYAQRVQASQRSSETEQMRNRLQILTQIEEQQKMLKQFNKNQKSQDTRRRELEDRKQRLKSKATMMNYLMKNRQPKKEAIKANPEPKENIEKKTGKESLNKLKEQTIGRKRFLEDGEPQNFQKPKETHILQVKKEEPKPQVENKPTNIQIPQAKEDQIKQTGKFNIGSTGSLFGNNASNRPTETQSFEKKEAIVFNQGQSLFGNMQINADKGGSLFGNITLPNKKEDLQKQNDPLIQPAIFPQAPTNNPFPQSIEKPKQPTQVIPPPPTLNISQPKSSQPANVPQKSSIPPIAPLKPSQKLTSEQFLQSYIQYVQNLKEEVPITSKIENISGARSSPAQTLAEIKALLNTIDKNNDKQITTFGLKLFQTILFKFINNSNVKSGLSRIPPKSRTQQCEKNAINCYVLACNMMRLMPNCKKIWVIVFGKTLKMLDFLYKRKTDLESFHKLELIQCGYVREYKEIHSKYISRIDFLIYFLLGLTTFDPLLVVKNIAERQPKLQNERRQIEQWGGSWSYAQFWSLSQLIFANKHESYFKPIFYMNLLYVLYPKVYEYKRNDGRIFKEQYNLFTLTIDKAKKYLNSFEKMKEIIVLGECDENERMNYVYDGDDFVDSIKLLSNRVTEKERELKLKAGEYEQKANIFYYFTKQK